MIVHLVLLTLASAFRLITYLLLLQVAGILRRIGQLEMNQKKFTAARESFLRALRISEAKYDLHPYVATMAVLGSSLLHRFGPDHPNTAENLYALGCVAFMRNKHYKAESLFKKAAKLKEDALGDSHPVLLRLSMSFFFFF